MGIAIIMIFRVSDKVKAKLKRIRMQLKMIPAMELIRNKGDVE